MLSLCGLFFGVYECMSAVGIAFCKKKTQIFGCSIAFHIFKVYNIYKSVIFSDVLLMQGDVDMKKFLALILSLLLLVTTLPLTASAETDDTFEYEGFSYKIEDDRVVIIGSEPTENGELVIPTEIDGRTKIDIDYGAFQNATWIKSLFISSSVNHIWDWAFDGCTELEQITFSEELSYICSEAFAHCTKLSEVILPTTLFFIDYDSFFECTSLPALTFAGENEDIVELDGILYEETMNRIMCVPGGYSGEVWVPSTVNVIPHTDGCPGVTAFRVEEGNEDFSAVDGILYDKEQTNIISCPRAKFSEPTEYTIPEGVIGFYGYAFYGCQNITKITVPAWVERTGMYAFAKCPDLKEIVFEEGFNSFNSFRDGTLSGCTNVEKVVIPASVTSFGQFTSTDDWNFTVYGIPKSYVERFTSLYNVPFVPIIAYDSHKMIVMKKEQTKAYINGVLKSTTDYGNGIMAKAMSKPDGYVLPLRFIGERFGMTVDYLGNGKSKITNTDGTSIVVNRGSNVIEKYNPDGTFKKNIETPIAAFTEDGITYVPLRAVSEALGLGVRYQSTAHGSYVVISTDVNVDSDIETVNAQIEKAYALGL